MILPRTIYAIQHNKSRRIYVGSSARVDARIKAHLQALRRNGHTNELMQADYNEYGEDYSFYKLDIIHDYEDRRKEYEWMKKYNSCDTRFGYNYKERTKDIEFIHYEEGVPEV